MNSSINNNSAKSAFTLIEMAIATAIAAVALVAILGVVPMALDIQGESIDQTSLGTVFEDVHDRLEGVELEPGVPSVSPLFYDFKGTFWEEENSEPIDRYFRVDLELIEPIDEEDYGGLVVSVKVFWPLNEEGEPFDPDAKPNSVLSYYATTLTGPGWMDVDPNFIPKIEY